MAFRAAAGGRRHAHGVVAVASDVPPELLADPDVRFPPVLLLRGTADPRYSQQQMDADAAALASRGVEVRAEVSSGDHEWTAAVSAAIGDFLKHL